MSDAELITIPGKWDFDYTYFAGEHASRFFHELRSSKRIMGTRCPKCARVLVPARAFCDPCMERTTEWVEVRNEGRVETFTIITTEFPGLPPPPIVIAYVTLDGADTALINVVQGLDLSDIDKAAAQLNTNPRVAVRFKNELKGRITDFTFELA